MEKMMYLLFCCSSSHKLARNQKTPCGTSQCRQSSGALLHNHQSY